MKTPWMLCEGDSTEPVFAGEESAVRGEYHYRHFTKRVPSSGLILVDPDGRRFTWSLIHRRWIQQKTKTARTRRRTA